MVRRITQTTTDRLDGNGRDYSPSAQNEAESGSALLADWMPLFDFDVFKFPPLFKQPHQNLAKDKPAHPSDNDRDRPKPNPPRDDHPKPTPAPSPASSHDDKNDVPVSHPQHEPPAPSRDTPPSRSESSSSNSSSDSNDPHRTASPNSDRNRATPESSSNSSENGAKSSFEGNVTPEFVDRPAGSYASSKGSASGSAASKLPERKLEPDTTSSFSRAIREDSAIPGLQGIVYENKLSVGNASAASFIPPGALTLPAWAAPAGVAPNKFGTIIPAMASLPQDRPIIVSAHPHQTPSDHHAGSSQVHHGSHAEDAPYEIGLFQFFLFTQTGNLLMLSPFWKLMLWFYAIEGISHAGKTIAIESDASIQTYDVTFEFATGYDFTYLKQQLDTLLAQLLALNDLSETQASLDALYVMSAYGYLLTQLFAWADKNPGILPNNDGFKAEVVLAWRNMEKLAQAAQAAKSPALPDMRLVLRATHKVLEESPTATSGYAPMLDEMASLIAVWDSEESGASENAPVSGAIVPYDKAAPWHARTVSVRDSQVDAIVNASLKEAPRAPMQLPANWFEYVSVTPKGITGPELGLNWPQNLAYVKAQIDTMKSSLDATEYNAANALEYRADTAVVVRCYALLLQEFFCQRPVGYWQNDPEVLRLVSESWVSLEQTITRYEESYPMVPEVRGVLDSLFTALSAAPDYHNNYYSSSSYVGENYAKRNLLIACEIHDQTMSAIQNGTNTLFMSKAVVAYPDAKASFLMIKDWHATLDELNNATSPSQMQIDAERTRRWNTTLDLEFLGRSPENYYDYLAGSCAVTPDGKSFTGPALGLNTLAEWEFLVGNLVQGIHFFKTYEQSEATFTARVQGAAYLIQTAFVRFSDPTWRESHRDLTKKVPELLNDLWRHLKTVNKDISHYDTLKLQDTSAVLANAIAACPETNNGSMEQLRRHIIKNAPGANSPATVESGIKDSSRQVTFSGYEAPPFTSYAYLYGRTDYAEDGSYFVGPIVNLETFHEGETLVSQLNLIKDSLLTNDAGTNAEDFVMLAKSYAYLIQMAYVRRAQGDGNYEYNRANFIDTAWNSLANLMEGSEGASIQDELRSVVITLNDCVDHFAITDDRRRDDIRDAATRPVNTPRNYALYSARGNAKDDQKKFMKQNELEIAAIRKMLSHLETKT